MTNLAAYVREADRMRRARLIIDAALSLRQTAHAYLREGQVKDAKRCYSVAIGSLKTARRTMP